MVRDNHSMKAQCLLARADRQFPPQMHTSHLKIETNPNLDHVR
jgi:hypothetical protein